MKRIKRIPNIRKTIKEYTKNNLKEYILVILIFIIGILIGIMLINNCSEEKEKIVTGYISEFIEKSRNIDINQSQMLIDLIKQDLILSFIIWISGTTIIGMPIVLGIITYRGFCLGYTISAISLTIGAEKSFWLCITALFLQNLIFIPSILTMGVSSIKLYKSIIADRRRENIKIEIIKHTMISSIMYICLNLSSLIESEISTRLLDVCIRNII